MYQRGGGGTTTTTTLQAQRASRKQKESSRAGTSGKGRRFGVVRSSLAVRPPPPGPRAIKSVASRQGAKPEASDATAATSVPSKHKPTQQGNGKESSGAEAKMQQPGPAAAAAATHEGDDDNHSAAEQLQEAEPNARKEVSTTTPTISSNESRDRSEPSDESLRLEYIRLEKTFLEGLERDTSDVRRCLEREKKFTVDYSRMSTNRLWAAKDGPVAPYAASIEEYKDGNDIWPRGRELADLSVYKQIWDFFCFMWRHTKPYSTVALILLMSFTKPLQNALLGYVAQEIEKDPKGVPLWLYFTPFFAKAFERFLYWHYELLVPLNSQRVQLRSVLLSQRVRFDDNHPLAKKWASGRFTGLLKDVDDVINKIWKSCLSMFDDMVQIVYLLVLCLLNLAWQFRGGTAEGAQTPNAAEYGTYVGVFVALGIVTMGLPFLWFHFFHHKVMQCEEMIREGQSMYMSSSSDAVAMGVEGTFLGFSLNTSTASNGSAKTNVYLDGVEGTARKAFWIFGRTTFRAFFHRLAWTANFSLISKIFGPVVAYVLLTAQGFGAANLTSTIIILVSLQDLSNLSSKLLDYLVSMSRGCSTLLDVAEILNADVEYKEASDIEDGGGKKGGKDL